MSKRSRLLTIEETQFIRDNWQTMSEEEMAKRFGMGVQLLASKRRMMGLLKYRGPHEGDKQRIPKRFRKPALIKPPKLVKKRPCPGELCDGVAERSEFRVLCTKCRRVWVIGSVKNEEVIASYRQGTILQCKSVGTNRRYAATKLGEGKSKVEVHFTRPFITFAWEDFLDMFYIERIKT